METLAVAAAARHCRPGKQQYFDGSEWSKLAGCIVYIFVSAFSCLNLSSLLVSLHKTDQFV